MNTKEPFTIDCLAVSNAEHECEIGEPGDATLDELGAQIHAYDQTLPERLEEQLRELLARPARSSEPASMRIEIEALNFGRSVRDILRLMPSFDGLERIISGELGRELSAQECHVALVVLDEISRRMVRALQPSITVAMPKVEHGTASFGIPDPPPPPPPPGIAMDPLRDGAES